MVVLVLSPMHDLVARVRRALRGAHELRPCATIEAARAVLVRERVGALVMECVDAHGVPTAQLVQTSHSSVPIVVALVRREAGLSPATMALLATRPTAVAVVEDLDLSCVARALGMRLEVAALTVDALPSLANTVSPGLRPIVDAALAHAHDALTVPMLARALGWHRATLWGRCRQHGLRSVEMLIVWCRLLVAARVLRTGVTSVEAVAYDLGFASPPALRNLIRRRLGITATELRLGGGESIAAHAFAQWLDAQRVDALPAETGARDVLTGDGMMRRTVTAGDAA